MSNFTIFKHYPKWVRRRRRIENFKTYLKLESTNNENRKIKTSNISVFRRRKIIFLNHLVVTLLINILLLLFSMPSSAIASSKYETAYACEGKTLAIECEPGDVINLVRANYGRFSITICNDHGNTDWSVNCMSVKSLRVLHTKCAQKQNCSVLASTNMFGDPCQGTHKYLEAHYVCLSADQTSTTTNRPSPPWLITSQPNLWSTTTSRFTTTTRINNLPLNNTQHNNTQKTVKIPTTPFSTSPHTSLQSTSTSVFPFTSTHKISSATSILKITTSRPFNGSIENDSTLLPVLSTISPIISIGNNDQQFSTQSSSTGNKSNGSINTNLNLDLNNESSNYFCPPSTSRNLTWNTTRVGEVNVQPCPGGATGLAKWRCVFGDNSNNANNDENSSKPEWQPQTPDLTQCRSLWLNNLEVRVNQRDSPLISIANELSQVTSSKTLYGGDMLVTIKIIHTMSEKMTNDVETFPDQRQREAIVYELLHGVVKTGSNLLDSSQHLSWLDLSFEDQMRVATSLLTGLEDCAFLLADTITRERNVVQKVKNILLSVRVLETRNIVGNEIFPDSNVEQWHVSDDRIDLPRAALIENSEGGLVRIVFVAFDRLESILRPTNILWTDNNNGHNNINNKYNDSSNKLNISSVSSLQKVKLKSRILNSKVISASLGKGRHIQLSQPIRLILKHIKVENVTNPACVYWNYIDHAWSEDGCFVELTNKTHTACVCSHLTNFAILMEITNENLLNYEKLFDNKILILIYISIAICIIFIVIAILALKLLNGIFIKSNRTTIYKNLYMCLLAIEILFLIGIELNETHILCGFTSAFLHCSFLCTIAWIFFEGFQLYIIISNDDILIESDKSSKIIWYYLLTYGLSFTIVAIALWIDPSTYTRSDYCIWMEQNNLFYFTFVAPIIFFIMANIVYSIKAFYLMCKKYTSLKSKEHTRLASVRFYLRCSIVFLIIFLSVWIFGYLYLNNVNNNLYGYIFIILNLIQGFYILVYNFIQNEKFRNEYNKYIRSIAWLPKCLRCFKKPSTPTSITNTNIPQNNISSPSPNAQPQSNNQIETLRAVNSSYQQQQIQPHQQTSNHFQSTKNSNFGTMRSTIVNSGDHQISPSSSVGSTHLIYNGQDWNYVAQHQQQPDLQTLQSRKFKLLKQQQHESGRSSLVQKYQPHHQQQSPLKDDEYFYWREKNKYLSDDLLQGIGNTPGISNYPLQTAAGTSTSYKKKYINDPIISSISHNHPQSSASGGLGTSNRYLYKMDYSSSGGGGISGGNINGGRTLPAINNMGDNYTPVDHQHFFKNSLGYLEEPVYEEILSNRISYSDNQHINSNQSHLNSLHHKNQNTLHKRNNIKLNQDDDEDDDDDGITDELIDENYKINNMLNDDKSRRPTLVHEQSDQKQQHQIGRNLSAMLDENNTVVCYLEPLPTK